MRKLIGVAVTVTLFAYATAALGAPPATAPGGDFVDLSVAVSPPVAGTAKKPQGVALTFDSFTGNRINGSLPSANNSIVVRLNRGFKDNAKLFPSCKINTQAVSTCAKNTQIGTGTAEASLPGVENSPPSFIPAKLTIYNGKSFAGSAASVIFIAAVAGQKLELDFSIRNQPVGPYGLAFTELVFPPSPGAPAGPTYRLTKFRINIPNQTVNARVHGKRVKVPLIQAPTFCRGAWKFEQFNGYSSGPPLVATDSQPCRPS